MTADPAATATPAYVRAETGPQADVLRLGWNELYLRDGPDGLLLIDAGPDYEGAWEELVGQLARLGVRRSDVRDVLVTHAHIDHAGLAARWRREGSRIWIGAADAAALRAGDDGAARMRNQAREFWRAWGVPVALFGRPAAMAARAGRLEGLRRDHYDHTAHWPAPLRFQPCEPDAILVEGARVGGLEVIACSGHTPGSAAFLDRAEGLLYTGDHLLPGITPPPGLNFDAGRYRPSLPSWLRSLERLRRLDGVSVLPAHGAAFDGLGRVLDRNLGHVEQRARRLLRLLRQSALSPYEALTLLFPHLPAGLLWFKLAEVVGLLDLLLDRGVIREIEGGPARYAAL